MGNTKFNTIIWDLGGVLIDWNPEYVFRDIFPDPEKRKWFFDNVCTHEWNLEQDRGRTLQEGTDLKVSEWPEYEDAIRAYYGQWEKMLGGPINKSVEMLDALKRSGEHQLLALTNWSYETFPVALERYDFLQWFEGIVMSGEEGMIKPEREIYELILDRYNVDPERAIFIDDNKLNIIGAREAGVHGIHFVSSEDLERELTELDVF